MGPSEIRAGIVSRLIAASTIAGARVDNSKGTPYPAAQVYPVINVWSSAGSGRRVSMSRPAFERTDAVKVVATVSGTSDADVARFLDQIEGQILTALFSDSAWDNQFTRVDFEVDKGPVESDQSRLRLGAVEVTLTHVQKTIVYDHAPEPPDDLELVRITTDVIQDGVAPDAPAEHVNDIELPGTVP